MRPSLFAGWRKEVRQGRYFSSDRIFSMSHQSPLRSHRLSRFFRFSGRGTCRFISSRVLIVKVLPSANPLNMSWRFVYPDLNFLLIRFPPVPMFVPTGVPVELELPSYVEMSHSGPPRAGKVSFLEARRVRFTVQASGFYWAERNLGLWGVYAIPRRAFYVWGKEFSGRALASADPLAPHIKFGGSK